MIDSIKALVDFALKLHGLRGERLEGRATLIRQMVEELDSLAALWNNIIANLEKNVEASFSDDDVPARLDLLKRDEAVLPDIRKQQSHFEALKHFLELSKDFERDSKMAAARKIIQAAASEKGSLYCNVMEAVYPGLRLCEDAYIFYDYKRSLEMWEEDKAYQRYLESAKSPEKPEDQIMKRWLERQKKPEGPEPAATAFCLQERVAKLKEARNEVSSLQTLAGRLRVQAQHYLTT